MSYLLTDDFLLWNGTTAVFPYPLIEVVSTDITDLWDLGAIDLDPIPLEIGGSQITQTPGGWKTTANFTIGNDFLYDFYNRIWVIPPLLNIISPELDVNIPFSIWNSYFGVGNNTLTTITALNAGDLNLEITPPVIFKPVQMIVEDLQIVLQDPTPIDGIFMFMFTTGGGTLELKATLATILLNIPDVPVTENWSFLTDVSVSWDGTEQRVALLSSPRREISYMVPLQLDTEWQAQMVSLFANAAETFVLPFYQYTTDVTVLSVAGTQRIYFDPSRTDLREGEHLYIFGPNISQLTTITTLFSDGAQIDFPLFADIGPPGGQPVVGTKVAPCADCFITNKTKISMGPLVGSIDISGRSNTLRASLSRPGSSSTFTTLGGYNVLDRRPLNGKETETGVDYGGDLIDYGTGYSTVVTSWKTNKFVVPRSWKINRLTIPTDMDWWRDFLAACNGQQVAFFMPTWRPDLISSSVPENASNTLAVFGRSYSTHFFPSAGNYKNICVETQGGIFFTTVQSVTINTLGDDVLLISPIMPTGAAWQQITNISLLVLVRLAGDRVTFVHDVVTSEVTMQLRSVDR